MTGWLARIATCLLAAVCDGLRERGLEALGPESDSGLKVRKRLKELV